ncbi:MAG: Ig-like domain-containing protein, partial [Bacteroidota bacterium]
MKQLSLKALIFSVLFLFAHNLKSEGTPQLSPTASDYALIQISDFALSNNPFAFFGSYGTSRSICFTVKDVSETVYIGLGQQVDGAANPVTDAYDWRIVGPSGPVHGPFTLTPANANGNDYNTLVAGPDVVNGAGYSTAGNYTFNPTEPGLYCIEFDGLLQTQLTGAFLRHLDITIVDGGNIVQDGRLFSENWSLRTPCSTVNNCPPGDPFAEEFQGTIYALTTDNYVHLVDFAGSGFRGLTFDLAFNNSGPGTSGDAILDRQSVNGVNATNPLFRMFLNPPDQDCYTPPVVAEIAAPPIIRNLPTECDSGDDFCIEVEVTNPGLVEVLLDFDQMDGIFTPNTADVLLAYRFEGDELSRCLEWDGLDGLGNTVNFNTQVDVELTYYQGEIHFMQHDVEYNNPGWTVSIADPPAAVFSGLHYWDDTQIAASGDADANIDGDNNPATNPPGTGINPPFVELNGDPQPGHIWNRNLASTSEGYGESNTINTWWFGNTDTESYFLNVPPEFVEIDVAPDSVSGFFQDGLPIDALANDTGDIDTSTICLIDADTVGLPGMVELDTTNGMMLFTPDLTFIGVDSFRYKV